MINLGIIGLGSAWESRYEPALERLSGRAQVRAVYDAVSARAEQVAAAHGARFVLGIRALLTRDDIDAVLLLDRGWQGEIPLRFLAEFPKPAYVAFGCGDNLQVLRELHAAASRAGFTIMPELRQRHVPATMRLQELLATRLGRPRRVSVAVKLPGGEAAGSPHDALMQALDWCRYVLRAAPLQVRASNGRAGKAAGVHRSVELLFPGATTETQAPIAHVELRLPEATAADRAESLHCRIECDAGDAELEAPDSISWTIGGESQRERLTAERPAEVVMLDHFCRRVVGGLIPVSDVSDVCRSIEWTRAAERSVETGRPVALQRDG